MASALSVLNELNEVAFLSGIFNWQMTNASYLNPGAKAPISFHVINNLQIPIEQYLQGGINAYNFVANQTSNLIPTDPAQDVNTQLFNTQLTSNGLREGILRKYVLNRVPFANYDQPVDLGLGSQRLTFNTIFVGTMYLTALSNFVQALFNNQTSGLGTLTHPFYGQIQNILPIEFNTLYNYEMLNCVICEVTFLTSDISHLDASVTKQSLLAQIGAYYIAIENTILSIGGTISAAKAIGSNAVNSL